MTRGLSADSPYAHELQRLKEAIGDNGWPASIRTRKLEGARRFQELGFPSSKTEEWRFTDIGRIVRAGYRQATGPAAPTGVQELWEPTGRHVSIVNGRAIDARTLDSIDGVAIGSLHEALKAPDPASPLGQVATLDEHPFVAMNTAFFRDGAYVEIADGADVPEPITISSVDVPQAEPLASYPRNVVRVGADARACIVEIHQTQPDGDHFSNIVTEIDVGANAHVQHIRLGLTSDRACRVSTLAVTQGRDSTFSSHDFTLAGGLTRSDVHVRLGEPGASCRLDGLFMTTGTQHADNYTFIDHAAPGCTSRQLYKGVLDQASRGVFHGRIVVRKDAQKSDASQHNRNLLLSDEALVNSTPALEINADDVKCTHGSTTGQLESDALFYLRSRGIQGSTARGILTHGFVNEVVGGVKSPVVRAKLQDLVMLRLENGPLVREALHGLDG